MYKQSILVKLSVSEVMMARGSLLSQRILGKLGKLSGSTLKTDLILLQKSQQWLSNTCEKDPQ